MTAQKHNIYQLLSEQTKQMMSSFIDHTKVSLYCECEYIIEIEISLSLALEFLASMKYC